MPTILKIGYNEFLFRRASDAAEVVKRMADSVPVNSRYTHRRTVYYPDENQNRGEVSMRNVQPQDILSADPGDIDVETTTPDRQPIRLLKS